MEDSTVTHTVSLDTTNAEAQLDRLIAKAEKLKSILTECEAFTEALDYGDTIKLEGVPLTAEVLPNIVYTIGLGDLKEILAAPADVFSPAFLKKVGDDFKQIANTKPKEPGEKKSAIILDSSKIGQA